VLLLYLSPAASDLTAWCRATPPAACEEIEEVMVGVIRAMVAFQMEHVQHLTVTPRVKMRKKKELKREEAQRNAELM